MEIQRLSWMDAGQPRMVSWSSRKKSSCGPDGVRVAEKTFAIENGAAIDVKISVDHDMVEVFVGEQVAFTYRIFRKPEYELGLLAQDAKVEFANIAIRK